MNYFISLSFNSLNLRQLTECELAKVQILTKNSIELTFIEPTKTGLNKSILDATAPIRRFLKEKNIHDFENQKQGPENKIFINSTLISEYSSKRSIASLYRPISKSGDPRIWFTNLVTFSAPNNIIGIIVYEKELYLINLSTLDIEKLLKIRISNPFKELIAAINESLNGVSNELLNKLISIASRGWIPAEINADTAIGRTLETLLGIEKNSSKNPDYKGIEIKSYRDKKKIRKNLFAQVPDWNLSKFKNSAKILNEFGYKRGDDFKLYCTVSAIVTNSQGLKLIIDEDLNHLIENSDNYVIGNFANWTLDGLHKRLLFKHNETFWIAADSKMHDNKEYFQYKKVIHTRKPIISQFDILLVQGIITVDHLIKRKNTGQVVEKGPLFKIKPNCLGLLFPPSNEYNLL